MKRDWIDAEFEVVGEEKPDHEPFRWVGLLELAWYGFGFLVMVGLGELIHQMFKAAFRAVG